MKIAFQKNNRGNKRELQNKGESGNKRELGNKGK